MGRSDLPASLYPNKKQVEDKRNTSMKEEWRPAPGFEKNYLVSNFGAIKNIRSGRILAVSYSNCGYARLNLSVDGVAKRKSVHRLVAEAFIPKNGDGYQVNHIDGNKKNNNVENLEWVTPSDNIKHAFNIGLKKPCGGVPPRKILCVETGEIFPSTWSVARKFGKKSQAGLYWALSCDTHTAFGYHWKYI